MPPKKRGRGRGGRGGRGRGGRGGGPGRSAKRQRTDDGGSDGGSEDIDMMDMTSLINVPLAEQPREEDYTGPPLSPVTMAVRFPNSSRLPENAPMEGWRASEWKVTKGAARAARRGNWKGTKSIVAEETGFPLGAPSYASIEAPPSFLPAKHYCDLTGLHASYKDPRTQLRYHNATVFGAIRFLDETTKENFLKLRNASTAIV